jgi:nucleotide-binding universal stress UspA family protein
MKLLAVVAEASTAHACLSAAVAAASRVRLPTTIEALHVVVDLAHAVTSSEEVPLAQLRELREGTALERADAARDAFLSWTAEEPGKASSVRWKEIIGAEEETVVREAKDVDLLVLAKPRNAEGRHALHAALFACGGPLLLVPADWTPSARPFGGHVAIAWNDTSACRRAIAGALPWLAAADIITIILINESEAKAPHLVALLNADCVQPSIKIVGRSHSKLGGQIVDEAHAVGADLLVAGAYRHSAFLEWLVGRTTRQMLRRADLPLLLAH